MTSFQKSNQEQVLAIASVVLQLPLQIHIKKAKPLAVYSHNYEELEVFTFIDYITMIGNYLVHELLFCHN